MNKVPTILTYNNHDILLKKKNQLLLLARKYNFYIVARWAVLSLKPRCFVRYYLVQVKKWEESEMLDKKFKRESLKWISMTCFSDHAENVVFSTYSISALVLCSAN